MTPGERLAVEATLFPRFFPLFYRIPSIRRPSCSGKNTSDLWLSEEVNSTRSVRDDSTGRYVDALPTNC